MPSRRMLSGRCMSACNNFKRAALCSKPRCTRFFGGNMRTWMTELRFWLLMALVNWHLDWAERAMCLLDPSTGVALRFRADMDQIGGAGHE